MSILECRNHDKYCTFVASGPNGSDASEKKRRDQVLLDKCKIYCHDIVMECILCRIGKDECLTGIYLREHPVPRSSNEQVHFDFYNVRESVSGEIQNVRDEKCRRIRKLVTNLIMKKFIKKIKRHCWLRTSTEKICESKLLGNTTKAPKFF